MWPFSHRERFALPSWTFQSLEAERADLSLALGDWYATDGLYLTKDMVHIGNVTAHKASIEVVRTTEGLDTVTLMYDAPDSLSDDLRKVLVIDSGSLCLHCEDCFVRCNAPFENRHARYVIHREAYRKHPRSEVVMLKDAHECCVGIISVPMWGDGAYRLEFSVSHGAQVLHVVLGESC